MELKYIWIVKYKNLKNIGFNFNNSNNESFSFNDGILSIDKIKNPTPKGFFKDNIEGLTCIVGKNGSGKTNLSEIIFKTLSQLSNFDHNEFHYASIIVVGKVIYVSNKRIVNNELENFTVKEMYKVSFKMLETIYYNPIFDFRNDSNKDYFTFFNLSTSYLLEKDLEQSNFPNFYNSSDDNNYDSLLVHKSNEKMREIEFLLNNFSNIDFIGRNVFLLYFNLDLENENALLGKYQKTPLYIISQLENEIFQTIKESIFFYGELHQVKYSIQKELFTKLFLIQLIKIISTKNNSLDFLSDKYIRFIVEGGKEPKIENHSIHSNILGIKKAFLEFLELCDWQGVVIDERLINTKNKKDLLNLFYNTHVFVNKETDKSIIIDLLNKINNFLPFSSFINFSYDKAYSSGQQKLLNFYSRFYWLKKRLNIQQVSSKIRPNILIFIDEGEVGLHPEWQRTYFDKMLTFLSKLFDDKKIQIVLTTHSPFVLSDIPKENVLFLDTKDGTVKLSEFNKQTFGANIHDLFADNFFMNNTIGEFTKEKINSIINFYKEVKELKNATLSDYLKMYKSKEKEFHFIVENIGEPVIKNILENHIEYIESKLGVESYKQKKIEQLEEEIKRLKK